jgi:hypothetical protein
LRLLHEEIQNKEANHHANRKKIEENAHQELINASQRRDWNDKVPRVEKI